MAEAGIHNGGRQVGARVWTALEGLAIMNSMEHYGVEESLAEKDDRWKKVSESAATDIGASTARKPSGVRDHVRAMYTTVRSASMSYSMAKKKPECPNDVDESNVESLDTFKTYAHALYEHVLTMSEEQRKKDDINLKWWNEELFVKIRLDILNQGRKIKAAPEAQRNKFESDQEAKRKLTEDNRKKREAEEQELRENTKRMAVAVANNEQHMEAMSATLGSMVNVLAKITTPENGVGAAAAGVDSSARLGNLESGLDKVRGDVSSMNSKLDQLLAFLGGRRDEE